MGRTKTNKVELEINGNEEATRHLSPSEIEQLGTLSNQNDLARAVSDNKKSNKPKRTVYHPVPGTKSEDISRCLNNCLTFYGRNIVKSDEECRERLERFFVECAETGQLPTMEKLFMALGTIRQTVWNWENGIGCSSERMDLIQKAKSFIAAFESEMVTEGKINPVVYIFRAKNYFGMKDQTEVNVNAGSGLGGSTDPDELAKRIEGNVIDADYSVEE